MRTPAEDARRLAGEMQALARRLADAEGGDTIFSRADVDRIVSDRLAREQRRTRKAEAERDALEAELEELR